MTKTIVLKLKPRRLIQMSGSVYVSIPQEWLAHHNLDPKGNVDERSVFLAIDDECRLIIMPPQFEFDGLKTY